MKELLIFYFRIILHPVSTLRKFLTDERRLIYGFMTILLHGILYTIGVILAYANNHLPYGVKIILAIPIEKYYLYESFFLLPITISTWIMLAGLVRIISLPFKGKGSFEDTLAAVGLPFIILIISMFIPDVIIDYLIPKNITGSFVFGNIINPARLFLSSFWIMIVHIIAVKEAQKVSYIKAIVITVISYIPYMAIVMTYIR